PSASEPAPKRKKRIRQVASADQPVPAPAPAAWAPRDWTTRVASGDAGAIVAEAEAHGIDAVLEEANAPALVALADAARYDGRRDLAVRVMLAERRRFPGTPAAANAAFFLGRLADDQGKPTDALDWYRRYLSEQSRGAYASEALGRAMLGVARNGRGIPGPLSQRHLPAARPSDPIRPLMLALLALLLAAAGPGTALPPGSPVVSIDRPAQADAILAEASLRLRAELAASGYDSRIVSCDVDPLAGPADCPRDETVASISLARAADATSIFVSSKLKSGLELRRQVRVRNDDGGSDATLLAVRAVELLRDLQVTVATT